MDQNTEKAFDEIEKALRPEVSKEQLGMVIEHLMEAIESMIEMPEEDDMESESEDAPEAELEVEEGSSGPAPIGDPMKNDVNWPVVKSADEENYESDNEEEDKWNNLQKACWEGYKQVGMKDKNGKMVPNCVPVEKVNKSLWDGTFNPSSIKK